ncbi:hypothetical protein PTKIN_Ptkin15bG0073900 [Pterospermum kingtungense]
MTPFGPAPASQSSLKLATVEPNSHVNRDPTDETRSFWKKLWNTHVPPKVKIFRWRLSHDILPTYGALARRHILTSPICPRCLSAEKTATYAVRDCSKAREVWAELPCKDKWLAPNELHVIQWLIKMVKPTPVAVFEEGLMLCWALWNKGT